MKNNVNGFTLVELIVVLTIVSILSTLGFVAYVDYLKGVRDSNRIQQMVEIQKAATLYGVKSRLPTPDDAILVTSGGNPIGNQGYASQSVLDILKYTDGGVDPKTKNFYTYFVSHDRKYSQILGFFEERNSNELISFTSGYANDITDYDNFYPRVVGSELGVLLEQDTQIPIQEIETYSAAGNFDIMTASGEYLSYATNTDISSGSGVDLIGMVPSLNCKKILEVLGSADSGKYKINPNGDKQLEVYCDMEIDGGGWTFAGLVDNDTNGLDIYFNAATGSYRPNREDSSELYTLNMEQLNHTEMIVTFDIADIQVASNENKFLQFQYNKQTDGFYFGPLMPGCTGTGILGDAGEFFYKTSIDGEYNYSNLSQCNSGYWSLRPTPHGGLYVIAFRNTTTSDGDGTGARYDSRVWGIELGDSDYDVSWSHDAYIYVR